MRRAAALVVLAACGRDAATPDAGIDAATVELPSCAPTFEHAYIERKITIEPPDQGRDIDGDGDVDNILGIIALIANPTIAAGLADGTAIVVLVLPELALPAPEEPVAVFIYAPLCTDADSPPDPGNNFDDGELIANLSVFDASCQPPTLVSIEQDGLSLYGEAVAPQTSGAAGLLDLRRVVFDGEIEPDGSMLEANFTGAYPACTLDRLAAAGATPGSILHNLTVNLGLQPDIDLDDDGIETIVIAAGEIVGCLDGDGTLIESAGCACDPRIIDGFSASVNVEAVPVRIVGTVP